MTDDTTAAPDLAPMLERRRIEAEILAEVYATAAPDDQGVIDGRHVVLPALG